MLTGTGSNYAYSKQISHDVNSFKDFYCFSVFDESTGIVTFNNAVNNISDEHIDYLDNNVHVKQSTNNHDFYNNSFIGSSLENTFYYQSVINNTFQSSSNNIFLNGTTTYNFFNFSGSNEIVNLNTSKLNYYVSFNYIRFTQNVEFQGTFINNIVNQLENSKFGVQSDSNIITSNFYQNDIGGYFRNNVISDVFYGNKIGRNFYGNTITADFYHNDIIGEFYSNTIDRYKFYNNNIIGNFYGNTILYTSEVWSFSHNLIAGNFYGNSLLILDFQRNIVNGDFYNNNLRSCIANIWNDQVSTNTFNGTISRCIFNAPFVNNVSNDISYSNFYGTFSYNTLANTVQRLNVFPDIGGINFTSSTIIYGNYPKEIVGNNAGTNRISYLDASFIRQYVNLTT
jgi:hypothetical protein